MDSLKINEDVCRICLKQTAKLHWNNEILNFCGVSYKDCYYKYTQLEDFDHDCYPTSLCEMCTNELENAHLLFEKALESFNFLQAVLRSKQLETKCEMQVPEEVDNVLTEDQTCLSALCDSETKVEIEDELSDNEKMIVEENLTVQPTHFIDIKDLALDETSFVQHSSEIQKLSESCDTKLSKSSSVVRKSRRRESLAKTSLKQQLNERYNTELPHTLDTKKNDNKIKNTKLLAQISSLQQKLGESEIQKLNESCDTKLSKSSSVVRKSGRRESFGKTSLKQLSERYNTELPHTLDTQKNDNKIKNKKLLAQTSSLQQKLGESCETISVLPPTKPKKLENSSLMCAYCSKILYNKYSVQMHEQTHMENRERKETCEICGLKFYDKKTLQCHNLIHKENRERIHKCEFCNKAFYNKGALNIHRRIHLGQMIPCSLCSKQFFRQIDLERHMCSHSATAINSEIKKRSRYFVRCKHCGKSILSTSFKSHTAAHLNEPLMKCSICNKEYYRRESCVHHVKSIHEKNYDYNDFIVKYKKDRLTHLFLEQNADIQFTNE